MEALQQLVNTLNDFLWGTILIYLLIGAGLFFTFGTKFVQFRYIGEMFRLMTDYKTADKKGVSSLQAFFISTASRVGTGNIAGVATAVGIGGPGAVFWMWIVALVGSASAFVEATLAQLYKVKDGHSYRGGPAYYMEKALGARWLGIAFAILITICFGLVFNAVQSNTIAVSLDTSFNINPLYTAIGLAIFTAIIIFGGVHRVAVASSIIVPVMAGAYLLVAIYAVITNISEVPAMFAIIFKNAFGLEQVGGGAFGAMVQLGIKRGLFSNEAGMGSAPNAAATAETSHPVKQGLIQALGVFVDTLMVCTATAFMILLSGKHLSGKSGIELTQMALTSHIGQWAGLFLSFCVFLFAFSSVIGNYYYGETNIEFIKNNRNFVNLYRLAVVAIVFLGAVWESAFVWSLADLFMGLMALLNLASIILLGKIAFRLLENYKAKRNKGEDPTFRKSEMPDLKNVDCWE